MAPVLTQLRELQCWMGKDERVVVRGSVVKRTKRMDW
jgi:hypothetical protein